MKKLIMICVVVSFMSAGVSNAAVTLDFTELPFQPVDGLNYMGVTFGFWVGGSPSGDAYYNSGGPGSVVFVQDPSLEGNAAGILTLDFATPTSMLEFGVVLSNSDAVTQGFAVRLYDTSLIGVYSVSTSPLVSYSEGQFTYSGPRRVTHAAIGFNDQVASRFALDNLTYTVPAPGAILLGGIGVSLIGWLRRRRAL